MRDFSTKGALTPVADSPTSWPKSTPQSDQWVPCKVQSPSHYSPQVFTGLKCHGPFCNLGGTEWSQPTEEETNRLLKYYRAVQFSLEKPQNGVQDDDYQNGIKHNMGVVWTLTIPITPRKRGGGRKKNKNTQITFLFHIPIWRRLLKQSRKGKPRQSYKNNHLRMVIPILSNMLPNPSRCHRPKINTLKYFCVCVQKVINTWNLVAQHSIRYAMLKTTKYASRWVKDHCCRLQVIRCLWQTSKEKKTIIFIFWMTTSETDNKCILLSSPINSKYWVKSYQNPASAVRDIWIGSIWEKESRRKLQNPGNIPDKLNALF